MTIVVNATFLNGQFQPTEALSLPEGIEVRLAVTPVANHEPTPAGEDGDDSLESVIGICSSGGLNLARDHDLYLYGPVREKENRE
jgi:predicted DNA-binding antitoxin AbrB/MazE fold protein